MEAPYYLFSEKYESWIRGMQRSHGVSFVVDNQTGELRVRLGNRAVGRFSIAHVFEDAGRLRDIERAVQQLQSN